jgi:hypothetical protein
MLCWQLCWLLVGKQAESTVEIIDRRRICLLELVFDSSDGFVVGDRKITRTNAIRPRPPFTVSQIGTSSICEAFCLLKF